MARIIRSELLDELPEADPRAIGSRRDLRRINACMGNARLMAARLSDIGRRTAPERIVDLGAGDGSFLLRMIRRLPGLSPGTQVVLVDRKSAPDAWVLTELRARGLRPCAERADVFDWLRGTPGRPGTWLVANLFLHHFSDDQLRAMFAEVGRAARVFCACEPHRSRWPLVASRLLAFIGANAVTRHDAVASVRAGFVGPELSALWPATPDWRLSEHRAGLFSHVFLSDRALSAGDGGVRPSPANATRI